MYVQNSTCFNISVVYCITKIANEWSTASQALHFCLYQHKLKSGCQHNTMWFKIHYSLHLHHSSIHCIIFIVPCNSIPTYNKLILLPGPGGFQEVVHCISLPAQWHPSLPNCSIPQGPSNQRMLFVPSYQHLDYKLQKTLKRYDISLDSSAHKSKHHDHPCYTTKADIYLCTIKVTTCQLH